MFNKKVASDNIPKIETYLKTKYNAEFEYVSPGNDVWSSVTTSVVFKDASENRFIVESVDGLLSDNYNSILFDEKAATVFQDIYEFDYKVFISTGAFLTGKGKIFKSVDEYLKAVSIIHISIYTDCQTSETTTIAPFFANAVNDKGYNIYVDFYAVTSKKYPTIDSYGDELVLGESLLHGSFRVSTDNLISSEMWRD